MKKPENSSRIAASAAAAAAAALLAAGCAAVSGASGPAAAASAASATPAAAGSGPERAAQQDAAALLGAFSVPAGALYSASPPFGAPAVLAGDADGPGGAQRVVRTGWWSVDESRAAVLAWITAHDKAPAGAQWSGSGTTAHGAEALYSYEMPATGVLAQREVEVGVAGVAGGRSVVRVDVVEVFRPAKPAGDTVPAAGYLGATLSGGANAPQVARTVAITDRAAIGRIGALIDALPTLPQGTRRSCPNDDGAGVTLTFRADAQGPVLARAVIALSGCRVTALTLGGTVEPTLDSSAPAFASALAGLLGLTLPGGSGGAANGAVNAAPGGGAGAMR